MELIKLFTYFIDFKLNNYFESVNILYELFKDNRIITYYESEDDLYITFRFTDNINTYTIIHHFTNSAITAEEFNRMVKENYCKIYHTFEKSEKIYLIVDVIRAI